MSRTVDCSQCFVQNGAYAKCAMAGIRPGEFFKLCSLCFKLHPLTCQPVLMMNCVIFSNYQLPARYEPFQFQHPIQVDKIKHSIQYLTLWFSLSQLYSCAAPHTNGFRLNTDSQREASASANVRIKECKTLREQAFANLAFAVRTAQIRVRSQTECRPWNVTQAHIKWQ